MKHTSLVLGIALAGIAPMAQSQAWSPDLGNGRYRNPIVFADYSDPDITRVGDDFYMVASSFNAMPGLPVLKSKDLVNWEIIGHVYDRLPLEKFDKPAHGEGSWAPTIRNHNGLFYVYFCTPHEGLFVGTAKDPAGKWELHQVADVEMWEDPSPLWDDDGNAYLVRGKLQAGTLFLHKMSADGKRLLDNGTVIFRVTVTQPTIEGPKFLKKDGYYYIFSPAGGVGKGWQTVLRSKSIYGPYEAKVVMRQGSTDVNGPHQGGMVELTSGEWWFIHFQDRAAYGRIEHLEPMTWRDGWPIIGEEIEHTGVGQPVKEWAKPNVGKTHPPMVPQASDEFNSAKLGLQWQWHANPRAAWSSLTARPGSIRLNSVRNLTQNGNLWFVPNLLLQKFPAPTFTATTKITMHQQLDGEKSGLVVMGREWAFIALTKTAEGPRIGMYTGTYNRGEDGTRLVASADARADTYYLRADVAEGGVTTFAYSTDNTSWHALGSSFQALPGTWIGAKIGLFSVNPNMAESKGYVDFDWFHLEPAKPVVK